jgi:uncharacterized protein YbaP (TraB family)
MWKAQKDGAAVYLLGSIHALRQDAYPLSPTIEGAFDRAEVVAFEVDMDEMAAGAFEMLAAGSYDDGRSLEEVVGAELWNEFSAKMAELGLPPAMFSTMKPWLAALSLAAFELERSGYSASAGIDTHLSSRAKEEGKDRVALETMEFQISLFAGLTPDESLSFLDYTLADLENMIPLLDEIYSRWLVGDSKFVQTEMLEQFQEFPELYEKMLRDRNKRWMPSIEKLLAGDRDAMVVVGAMHLVGEDGLVEMLRERGYTVIQQ